MTKSLYMAKPNERSIGESGGWSCNPTISQTCHYPKRGEADRGEGAATVGIGRVIERDRSTMMPTPGRVQTFVSQLYHFVQAR